MMSHDRSGADGPDRWRHRIEGQGNQLIVNQVVQISAREVLARAFLPPRPIAAGGVR